MLTTVGKIIAYPIIAGCVFVYSVDLYRKWKLHKAQKFLTHVDAMFRLSRNWTFRPLDLMVSQPPLNV